MGATIQVPKVGERRTIIKIKGVVEVRDDVNLTELTLAVNAANEALAKIGTGGITVAIPRGEYRP